VRNVIKTFSFSRLGDFEKCQLLAKLKYIDKIPEPERKLRAGQSEHANDRGSRIHDAAEQYVRNPDAGLIPELKQFTTEFEQLKELFQAGKVILEQEWAIDKDWQPTAWNSETTWCRAKLDAFIRVSETEGVAIDYKTGKRYGNEVKHGEQLQFYQLLSFLRYPELQKIDVQLWYLDLGETHSMQFTREQGMRFFKNFNDRGLAMTTATEFPPNPNKFSCRWCLYGPKGSGHCTVGV
jgi:hypothetical protein